MFPVLITLTPGRRNDFIDCQMATVRVAVLRIMDMKTHWNSTMQLLERAYRWWEFTSESLQHPIYSPYWPLFTTLGEWTIVKSVMKVLRPFQYWALRMWTRHMVTFHHDITVYNNMFDHIDGIMRALAKMETQRKEVLFFGMTLAQQMLSKY